MGGSLIGGVRFFAKFVSRGAYDTTISQWAANDLRGVLEPAAVARKIASKLALLASDFGGC